MRRPLTFVLPAVLVALASCPAAADVVLLTQPYSAECVVSPGAQYSVDGGALIPVRGEFSVAAHGMVPLSPHFSSEVSARPGELVRMYFTSSDSVDAPVVEIRWRGRILARGRGFQVTREPADPLWVILVGLSPSVASGSYEMKVTASAGTRTWELLRDFDVLPRDFHAERIPINGDLTVLRTVPDPRKTAESNILARVLVTPHADNVYEIGPLQVPLAGARRTSGYGDRRIYDYSDGTHETAVHFGVDIASPTGTPVPAAGSGRVVFAAMRILTGNTVIIEHLPGLFSIYYHMSSIKVAVGDVVEKGAIIGAVGMTGFATGPHLHWETEIMGVPVDPDALAGAALLDKEPVFPDIQGQSTGEGR
jgi:murein DD-endopeptidase MepM/ murein hydrolase activator NlpD